MRQKDRHKAEDQHLDPHRWYKMVVQDEKVEESTDRKTRKKLRQKEEKLKQERWRTERVEQDKQDEKERAVQKAYKEMQKENREANAKARIERRTKLELLQCFQHTNTPEGNELAAIIADTFSKNEPCPKLE